MPQEPSQTISAGAEGMPETTTDSTADPVAPKIDFVDTIILTGVAFGVDLFGMIPVVGEVMTPIGIGGFRLLFYFWDINSSTTNWLGLGLGGGELVPALSEVLPGCTAYVLTVCLTEQFAKDVKKVAETVAKVSPEPESKLAAAGVAAAMDVQQGKSTQEAVQGQAANAFGGGATAAAGASGASTAASAKLGAEDSSGGSSTGTMSVGGEQDFRGNFDFGSIGANKMGGRPGVDEKDEKRPGDLAKSGASAYAEGSPLVEGQPQVGSAGDNVNTSFVGRRKKQLEEERKQREEDKKAA